MVEGGHRLNRREVFLGAIGVGTTALFGDSAEARERHLKNDFSSDVLSKEILRLSSGLSAERKNDLLSAERHIFNKAEEKIMAKRLKGEGQEEKYFSVMMGKWEKAFPIIVDSCADVDENKNRQRNFDLEGVVTAILCGESAMKVNLQHKGTEMPAGYYQIEKATALAWGLKVDEKIDQRYDFTASTKVVAKYLKRAHARYGQWGLAMMAFGKGDGAVRKIIKDKFGVSDFDPEILSKKEINIVTIYQKTKEGRHTFIKEVLARHFKKILEHSDVTKN